MFYEEHVIHGVLCCRTSPSEPFRPLSAHELTHQLLQTRAQLIALRTAQSTN